MDVVLRPLFFFPKSKVQLEIEVQLELMFIKISRLLGYKTAQCNALRLNSR